MVLTHAATGRPVRDQIRPGHVRPRARDRGRRLSGRRDRPGQRDRAAARGHAVRRPEGGVPADPELRARSTSPSCAARTRASTSSSARASTSSDTEGVVQVLRLERARRPGPGAGRGRPAAVRRGAEPARARVRGPGRTGASSATRWPAAPTPTAPPSSPGSAASRSSPAASTARCWRCSPTSGGWPPSSARTRTSCWRRWSPAPTKPPARLQPPASTTPPLRFAAGGPGKITAVVQRAGSWLAWWVCSWAYGWRSTTASAWPSWARAVAAALAALLTEAALHQADLHPRLRSRWLAGVYRLPGQVLGDTVIVFRALAGRLAHGEEPPSGFRELPVQSGTRRGAVTRRVLLVGPVARAEHRSCSASTRSATS